MAENGLDSTGVARLEDEIRKLGSSVERALVNVSHDVAEDAVAKVRTLVPYVSGQASRSYAARVGASGVEIAFGGPDAPYVPWLEFGGRAGRSGATRPYVPGGRYLYPTIRRATEDWESEILRALDGLTDLEVD